MIGIGMGGKGMGFTINNTKGKSLVMGKLKERTKGDINVNR